MASHPRGEGEAERGAPPGRPSGGLRFSLARFGRLLSNAPLLERQVRSLPIRWRILAIAVLNSALALILLVQIGNGARILSDLWTELQQVRQSDRLLVTVNSETGRLQSLIHRYFTQPDPAVLSEIIRRREALVTRLKAQVSLDPITGVPARVLIDQTEKFLEGFDALRAVRTATAAIYETDILRPAREMAGIYAIIESATEGSASLVRPSLSKSRDDYNSMLLAANAYFLSLSQSQGETAKRHAQTIVRTAPVMADLAENDLQRTALTALRERAATVMRGLDALGEKFGQQRSLLSEAIDATAAAMTASTDELAVSIKEREAATQERFDRTLAEVGWRAGIVALGFVLAAVAISVGIARSINGPLRDLERAMTAIVAGRLDSKVRGTEARDEIGAMARATEVFRENAIAKRAAEAELREAKERAESALQELRETQGILVESEKLSALGGMVAGVAHEVNNPVGISLTVASSLARRCEEFSREIESGALRRSRLVEFAEGNRDAAEQLVANLQRAAELIQSFKQVAVDRSNAERRAFDLKESIEQIAASLRPGFKNQEIALEVDVPEGIVLDSYPGALGQVLTNLVLNAVRHAFPGDRSGRIAIAARPSGRGAVDISVADNGAGMSSAVQRRAFEPFFTTRRGEGGTGLGLHIVYNLVTGPLGGRIALASRPGEGSAFNIHLPLKAAANTEESA